MSACLWQPDPQGAANSRMAKFLARANSDYGLSAKSYADLYAWSLKCPSEFWSLVWNFFAVKHHAKPKAILEQATSMPGAQWFSGAQLNYAENLLRFRDDRTAIIFRNEKGERRSLTYRELYRQVATVRQGLEKFGIQKGDRVAAYLPNIPETVIVMLATASLGAVFSSASPDFGVSGVIDRFGQIDPKIFFTADGYTYNGKVHHTLHKVQEIVNALPSIGQTVVVPYIREAPDLQSVPQAISFDVFVEDSAEEIDFVPLDFSAPLYILYSSGTTGKPKCIVHSTGGVLLQHLKELGLHCDLQARDTFFYYTTCGWMMWNWLVSGLAFGVPICLYDGSPVQPNPESLLRMAQEESISIFGTSAKYLSAIEKANVKANESLNLKSIRSILSTGSPLLQEQYDYVYGELKSDVQLSSISGGTDIVSCFALGNPMVPVYRGELQSRGLGMAVEIFDETGHSVVNQTGELVCTRPFPAMPIGFWNDPGNKRYHRAYFERFPGVWCHGDWALLNERGGLVIFGRSDTVLNPGGVRIGTAEIYRQVEKLPEILESLAVGQEWKGDIRIILFVRVIAGEKLTARLKERICQEIRDNASPRHVPSKILDVADIPRTRSGKITEVAVREIIHGRPVGNRQAIANPESLEAFRNRPELQED